MKSVKEIFFQEKIGDKPVEWFLDWGGQPDAIQTAYKLEGERLASFGAPYGKPTYISQSTGKIVEECSTHLQRDNGDYNPRTMKNRYEYDVYGNLIRFTDSEWNSDSENFRIEQEFTVSNHLAKQVIYSSYDMKTLDYLYENGRIKTIIYKKFSTYGHEKSLELEHEDKITFNFLDSTKELIIRGKDWKEIRRFNSFNKIINRVTTFNGEETSNFLYEYDENHNLIRKVNPIADIEILNKYDEENRLVTRTQFFWNKEPETKIYSYSENKVIVDSRNIFHFDDSGNLLKKTSLEYPREFAFNTKQGFLSTDNLEFWNFHHSQSANIFSTYGVYPYPVFTLFNSSTPNILKGDPFVELGEHHKVTQKEKSVYSYCSLWDEIDFSEYNVKVSKENDNWNDYHSDHNDYDEDGTPFEDYRINF